ncbi:MAG: GSU2403 family nucleotidyltransferase fold protein, partial [Candidatus Aerophobetes bacterium]|nr:GSU2403 family nucleotidyltransferase fold protein [Candidatus Aerophobetes bacterium]
KIITLDIKGLKVKIPHPACFLLHKIIVLHKRETDKKIKDLEQIERIIDLLRKENELPFLKKVFDGLHSKWQRRIVSNLRELSKSGTIALLLSGRKKKNDRK